MEMELKEKIVVITGGAEGLGYEISSKFLENGVKTIIILDINEEIATKTVEEFTAKHGNGKAVFIPCDVTKDLDDVSKKIFDTYGTVDVLVNNAGLVDENSARKTLEVNTLAVLEWSTKFWEHMRKDKGGRGGTIINMGSIYGLRIDPFTVFYKASKFAVVGFSKCLGHEYNYNKSGVRVLTICPGFTATSIVMKSILWKDQLEDFMEFHKTQLHQKAEAVGKAAVEVFQKAPTGTAWIIEGGVLTEATN